MDLLNEKKVGGKMDRKMRIHKSITIHNVNAMKI